MIRRVLLSALFGLLFWVSSQVLATEQDDPAECLLISDIHLNPFLDPGLFAQLVKRPASEWAQVLESSLSGGVSQYGSDSNYPLLRSALVAAANDCPRPDFILYVGDSLAHNWRSQYEKLAPRSSHDDPAAYRTFTAKTIEFLALELQKHFPDVPILPAIGNEDAYCGDYKVQPAGPFLEMFARAWMALPGPALEPAAFQRNFSRGGYYSVLLPSLSKHRVIVLNSVFFSNQYENACGSNAESPGDDEMAWLAAVLDTASRAQEKVWLVMHIPVGINDYNTVKDEETGSGPVEFWLPGYSSQFIKLMGKFRNTIQIVFSGHTHMDDFRVIEAEGTGLVVNKLVPSISPIFRNNPGFQVYHYDRESGAVRNYRTYYLSNLSTAGKPTEFEQVKWEREYDFSEAYQQPALDISAIISIARALKTDTFIQGLYTRFYSVSGPPGFDSLTLSAYSCAILHTTLEEFEKCQHANGIPAKAPGVGGDH
jgi:sphingomyelin phosphodiesterase acid-like 3